MHVCCIYIRVYRKIYIDEPKILKDKILYSGMPLGISYISSCLKQAGYTTEMVYCTHYTYGKGIYNYIKKEPKVFAISVVTFIEFDLASKLVNILKKKFKNSKIIIGGPLVTIDTKNIFDKMKNIDALCIGAGEKAVVEYVKQVEQGKYYKTDNLWIRDGQEVLKCDKVISIENLDELPYPDRIGWENIGLFNNKQNISMNRGCIYNCTFCTNTIIQKNTNNIYFRKRSVENIIKEVDYLYKFYNVKEIGFICENALTDKEIFKSLCIELKKYNDKLKTKIAFRASINFTPNLIYEDRDIINLMKEANFIRLNFSLESGSFEIRKKLQKPNFTNEQIIKFFDILKEKNISTLCYVMYCFPFETKETYLETLECLKKCKSDMIMYQILKATPGTQLYDELKNKKIKKFGLADMFRYLTFEWRLYKTYKPIIEIIDIFFPTFRFFCIRKVYIFLKDVVEKLFEQKTIIDIKLGKKNFNKGNYKKAIEYYDKITIKEHNYWIYGDRAMAKMNIGDYKEAIKDFDKILQLNPNETFKQKRQECLDLLNLK